jgi:hypothetical protein
MLFQLLNSQEEKPSPQVQRLAIQALGIQAGLLIFDRRRVATVALKIAALLS